MKLNIAFFLLIFANYCLYGQSSGNVNYQNQTLYPEQTSKLDFPPNANLQISIKGMANLKADAYVAVFSLTQVGKTVEEVNTLIDNRINQSLEQIAKKEGVETLVDMISFVPTYEYEVEKKIFSKKTYNEVPSGFEVKKNIHIKYSKPEELNEIMTILAKVEVYDLVKVDYFSNQIETVKKDLMAKAKNVLQEKLQNYQNILGENLDSSEKRLIDAYRVVFPIDMYRSYEVFSSSALNPKKNAQVNQSDKSTTLYYQAFLNNDCDFVINPTIVEPVIQVIYELKMLVIRQKEAERKVQKEYFLISPTGELKSLKLDK